MKKITELTLKRIIILITVVTVIMSIGFFYGYGKGKVEGYWSFMRIKEQFFKQDLLKSSNLSSITYGVALQYIPTDKITFNPYSSHTYEFNSYGVTLTNSQFDRTVDHFNKTSSLTGPTDYLYFDTPVWTPYMYSQSDNIVVKDGFACIYPVTTDPVLCAAGGQGSCIYSQMNFSCSYISNPKENTYDKVSTFMTQELKEAGLPCTYATCKIEDKGKMGIPIPQYAKSILYFEDIKEDKKNSRIVAHIEKEARHSKKSFMKAGWKATAEDITKQEQSWSSEKILTSIRITADNPIAKCMHTVTVLEAEGKRKKREMIECSAKLFQD